MSIGFGKYFTEIGQGLKGTNFFFFNQGHRAINSIYYTIRHHQLNGHEAEQTLGDGEGQGSLVC